MAIASTELLIRIVTDRIDCKPPKGKTKVSGTVIDFLSDWAPPRQHVDDPSVEEAHSAASAEDNPVSRTPGKSARPATGTRVDVPTTRPRQQDTKQRYLTDTFSL
jgi:hypothetical protein